MGSASATGEGVAGATPETDVEEKRSVRTEDLSQAHTRTASRARLRQPVFASRVFALSALGRCCPVRGPLPIPPSVPWGCSLARARHAPFAAHRKRSCCLFGVPSSSPAVTVTVTLTHLPQGCSRVTRVTVRGGFSEQHAVSGKPRSVIPFPSLTTSALRLAGFGAEAEGEQEPVSVPWGARRPPCVLRRAPSPGSGSCEAQLPGLRAVSSLGRQKVSVSAGMTCPWGWAGVWSLGTQPLLVLWTRSGDRLKGNSVRSGLSWSTRRPEGGNAGRGSEGAQVGACRPSRGQVTGKVAGLGQGESGGTNRSLMVKIS